MNEEENEEKGYLSRRRARGQWPEIKERHGKVDSCARLATSVKQRSADGAAKQKSGAADSAQRVAPIAQ
jgi:hypothetical protein